MSKFLSAMSDPEEEEDQQQQQLEPVQEEKKEDNKAAKNKKKKDKKKNKGEQLEQFQEKSPENLPDDSKTDAPKEQKQKPADKKEKAPPKQDNKPLSKVAQLALERKKQKEEEEKRIKEEEERLKREEDERIRIEEEEERLRKEQEERERQEKLAKKQKLMEEGKYMTKAQKKEQEKLSRMRQQLQVKVEDNVDKSNVVRRTKKKKEGETNNVNNNVNNHENDQEKVEEKLPEKKEEKQPEQKQEIKEERKEQKQPKEQLQQQQQEQQPQDEVEVDDWEKLDDDYQPPTQKEEQQQTLEQTQAPQPQQQQPEEQKQQTSKETKDTKKSSSTMNKELQQMFQNQGELRSPICCILGHVDTGKTTLLDKIRNTNVQEGEAGGITQQIGATFFPHKKLIEELKKTLGFYKVDCNVPGLLIIDTPGHESFSNLRTRGSSLCDLAILVVDLMHGLEKQTLESLELLKMRKTPFVIALNKIDRCVEWQKRNMGSSYEQLQKMKKTTKADYETRKQQIVTQLGEQGFNVAHYWENPDPSSYVSIVPTSGITGEGIPDLLAVIVKYTSQFLKKKVAVKNQFNCTVLERKVLEGHGHTIDCILVDGILRRDDRIVLQGFQGPIVTKVKAILTPHPMKEQRVKGEYINHEVIHASMGLKIAANDLEEAVAGSQVYVVPDENALQDAIVLLQNDYDAVKQKIKLSNTGVGVVASTLGSLEALLKFLEGANIPVSYVSVGPVSKDDVMKAAKNVLMENPERRKKEYAVMLVFDIKVLQEAREYAEQNQIKIFEANIIYHLFDQFMAHVKNCQEERKRLEGKDAVFPCLLKIVAIFNKKDPIILGVDVEQGVLKPGTPICVYNSEKLKVGVVESIESNHKTVKEARLANGSVAVRIKTDGNIQVGRHFDQADKLASILSRHSIDMLKQYFREEISLDDWQLVKDLKGFHGIM